MPGISKTAQKEFKGKNLILLTGATGYVGGRLLKVLEESQFRLRCLARRPELLSPRVASKTDVEQAYALGKAAVEMAIAGENAVMPTIIRKSDSPYVWEVGMAKLEDVANVEKMMPKEFITDDGFGITEACRRYLLPLIDGEDYPSYKNGMPEYVTLKNKSVAKIVKTDFKL